MFNEEDLLDEGFKERTSYELSKIPVKINSYKLKKAESDLEELKKVKKELDDDDGNFDYIKSKKARENAKSKIAFKKEWVKDDAERLKNKIKINREKLNNSNKIYEDKKRKYELSTIKKEDTNMYYTNEELLEAVDILVEEYGFDEEEAIDMVNEAYEEIIISEGYIKNTIDSYKDAGDSISRARHYGKGYRELSKEMNHPEKFEDEFEHIGTAMAHKYVGDMYKNSKKVAARDTLKAAGRTVAPIAVAGGAAYLTHRAYKAHKAKKEAEAKRNKGLRGKLRRLREDYGIYEENGELFIESEMVEYVMSAYDLYEEDAIEVIVDCYNKGLDDEDLM